MSNPMTCPQDMVFNIIYGGDKDMVLFYIHQSMQRLDADWEKNDWDHDTARVLFFLLLDKDMELKHALLNGLPELGITPMAPLKAEAFFMYLYEDVIQPWMSNGRKTPQDFIDAVANHYFV